MSQAKLTHTLGDNINQSLLIRDNLCCFLKKLSRHMAQGTNGAGRLGRELKDTRHAACKRGGNKLQCEHGKMSVDFPNEAARCQRFLSRRAQSSFEPRDENGLAGPRSPCYLMQNARSKDRVCGANSVKRAVAQLGRAPGSGPGGRGFKSHQPDFNELRLREVAAETGPSFKSVQFDSTS